MPRPKVALALIITLLTTWVTTAAGEKPPVPDLTKGGEPDKTNDWTLGPREGDFAPRLLKLLSSKDMDARYGAVEAIGQLGPRADAAGPQVLTLLRADDPWLLCLAADTLARMGPDVRKAAIPELLRLTVREIPGDPRQHVSRAAAIALFSPMPGKREPKSILAESLDGVDRGLLYPAVKAVLGNEDGATRGLLRGVYGKLDDHDIVALLPAIVKAIKEPSPSSIAGTPTRTRW